MKRFTITLLLLLAISALAAVSAETLIKKLEPFTGLSIALPFPVKIVCTLDQQPEFKLDTDEVHSIDELIKFEQKKGDVLYIGLQPGRHEFKSAVNSTISVVPRSLKAISVMGAGSICMNGSAAVNSSFDMVSKGAGSIVIISAPFSALKAKVEGAGSIGVNATSIKRLEFDSSGAGEATFAGSIEEVKLDLKGASTANVIADGDVKITGEVKGVAEVNYTKGTCSVRGISPFAGPCHQVDAKDLPEVACPANNTTSNSHGSEHSSGGGNISYDDIGDSWGERA